MAKKSSKTRATARKAPPSARRPRLDTPVTPAAKIAHTAAPIIVGVGASAGGLEAFTAMLRHLPADANLAVVFVQHLAPQHDSALVALLTGQSAMPVVQAEEDMRVEANHVYVIPPNRQLVIAGRTLHVNPRPGDKSQYTPIDAFLLSLAESAGSRVVGVILSGTASDGSVGIAGDRAERIPGERGLGPARARLRHGRQRRRHRACARRRVSVQHREPIACGVSSRRRTAATASSRRFATAASLHARTSPGTRRSPVSI